MRYGDAFAKKIDYVPTTSSGIYPKLHPGPWPPADAAGDSRSFPVPEFDDGGEPLAIDHAERISENGTEPVAWAAGGFTTATDAQHPAGCAAVWINPGRAAG